MNNMSVKTLMSNKEYAEKKKKIADLKKAIDKKYLERGIAMSTSGRDEEDFLKDSGINDIDNQIAMLKSSLVDLQKEIDTAEIVKVMASKDSNGNLKIAYGSRLKIRYYFSEDDIDEQNLIICNVGATFKEEHYEICTPVSPLYKFIKGKSAGYKGTYTGPASQNSTIEYDFEIIEVLPPDPSLVESAEKDTI
jgi:hypothetical protein